MALGEKTDKIGHWKGTRTFLVDAKEAESQTVTSFYLRPEDGGPLASYKPGQFLSFQLDRRSVICANSTVFPKSIFRYF